LEVARLMTSPSESFQAFSPSEVGQVVFVLMLTLVALMFETHSRIVFRSGTGARRPNLKCLRNALCVAITDSLFLKNVSTTKPRCSSDQPMVLYEYGKTTANQRDPPSSLYPLHSPSSDPSKCGSYFCRILYKATFRLITTYSSYVIHLTTDLHSHILHNLYTK